MTKAKQTKMRTEAYKMYRSLDDMNTIVFDIYHDRMKDVLDYIRWYLDDEDFDEAKRYFDRMKLLSMSASLFNESLKTK